jgi:hypothetical protein
MSLHPTRKRALEEVDRMYKWINALQVIYGKVPLHPIISRYQEDKGIFPSMDYEPIKELIEYVRELEIKDEITVTDMVNVLGYCIRIIRHILYNVKHNVEIESGYGFP